MPRITNKEITERLQELEEKVSFMSKSITSEFNTLGLRIDEIKKQARLVADWKKRKELEAEIRQDIEDELIREGDQNLIKKERSTKIEIMKQLIPFIVAVTALVIAYTGRL